MAGESLGDKLRRVLKDNADVPYDRLQSREAEEAALRKKLEKNKGEDASKDDK
jgi:hypothetical protein